MKTAPDRAEAGGRREGGRREGGRREEEEEGGKGRERRERGGREEEREEGGQERKDDHYIHRMHFHWNIKKVITDPSLGNVVKQVYSCINRPLR